jgi:polyisoprenoid-binding protein YceI
MFTINTFPVSRAVQFGMAFFLLLTGYAADAGSPITLLIDNGAVTFDATTNISAVNVHGKSSGLKARVKAKQNGNELMVEEVAANLPIGALSTGMGLRDEHMKQHIFTTKEGQTPDLKFTGSNLVCPVDAGKETTCKVTGQLSIRGAERPLTMMLKVKADSASKVYRAAGDGTVKLSDYGIERPSQFGVKCADEVKIHIDFLGKETTESAARVGDGR